MKQANEDEKKEAQKMFIRISEDQYLLIIDGKAYFIQDIF
jgi:hypothetical protein